MKRRVLLMLALSGSFATGLIVGEAKRRPRLPAMETAQSADGPFRDGLYQAKLDTEEGRKPHPAIGRWSSAEARASFLAGYQTGYRAPSEAAFGRVKGPSVAEMAATGYRDGMLDGGWHRAASQPFQAEQTANYRAGGVTYLGENVAPDEFKHFYREGYLNGYRHAYFTQAKLQGEKTDQ
jgi:hypothetical protein